MTSGKVKTLSVTNRREWRRWLGQHHDSESEIWLVFNKLHTGRTSLPYDDAVEEALCHGWIDSIVRRVDDVRYARKFTPRKPDSNWSAANRKRYEQLEARGLLAAPGLARPPTGRTVAPPPFPSGAVIPPYIKRALRSNARAWEYFEQLAPSYRRTYIGWIESAKRDTTKEKRLQEAVRLLAAGKKLGLK